MQAIVDPTRPGSRIGMDPDTLVARIIQALDDDRPEIAEHWIALLFAD